MRIAFIGQKGIVLGKRAGGIERHVAELSTRLVLRGAQVRVYARKKYSKRHPRWSHGVRMHYPPTIYTKNTEAIVHVFLATIDILFRRVDVIHYQGVGPALLCWIPRILRPRTTVIVTFHAQDRFHQKWGWFARRMLHLGEWVACHIPHATITVSHAMQMICREEYGIEAIYVPNGAVTRSVRKQTLLGRFESKKGEYLLNVGRIMKVKGLHHLIRAFRRLSTKKKLVIVGAPSVKDEYYEELKRLAEGDGRIVFTGFQEGEMLDQLFAHAYLYIQPSESEGLPLAVIEAMGFGTAVLVSDIPGNLEVIHRAGFTFENKDVGDLETQLKHLLRFPPQVEKGGKDARETVKKYFDWDHIASQTEEVYRSFRH